MGPTRFTVVVPLRDRVDLAVDAVQGALGQTLPPIEVLVVDDGSAEDGTDALAALGPTVRVLHRPPEGVGAARNAGLDAASTPWVAFLDADDRWHPDHLAELDRVIAAHPEAALVSTDHVQTLDRSLPDQPAGQGRIRRIDYFPSTGRRIGIVWTSAAAVRREVALDLGGFGPWPRGEDLELWARIALHHPVATSTARTARYVRGTGGVMERPAGRTARPPVRSHADVSPSAATAAAALAAGDHAVPAAHLRRYLDGRVLGLLRRAAMSGDRVGAAAASDLMFDRRRPAVVLLRVLALTPAAAAVVAMLRRARRSIRALRPVRP